MIFAGGLHRNGWLQLAEARSRSPHLMKRPKRGAPGHSSNRARTRAHFEDVDPNPDFESVVMDSREKMVSLDIGLDGVRTHDLDERRSTQPLPTDPDKFGLVPAFTLGDVHVANLPDRYYSTSWSASILYIQLLMWLKQDRFQA